MPRGRSERGPATRTLAPSVRSAKMLERATRLWSMSPQITTVSPSILPLCARMVEASSSAWVGCSCAPSPAFTMAALDALGEQQRRAGLGVADDHDVRIHGIQVHRGVDERLALDRGRRGGGEVDPVGGQALGRNLERGAGARRRLQEQVDDRLAAQGGHLLDGPIRDLQEALAQVEDGGDLLAGSASPCRAGAAG